MSPAPLAPPPSLARRDGAPVLWTVSPGLTPYPWSEAFMTDRAEAIAAGHARELVWLVEHPSLYTAGVSAKEADLLDPTRLPVFRTGRGGQFTWHGPGQRVVYLMLDLRERGRDVSAFVAALEAWIVRALGMLGVDGLVRKGRVGVWVAGPDAEHEAKLAAIGVKLRRWVSSHGVSLNVAPDLRNFEGIVPCGLPQFEVTSLERLGVQTSMAELDAALETAFMPIFGPLEHGAAATPAPV